jgi:hypothetical protein
VECLIFFSKITKDPAQFITSNDEEQMNKVQEERVLTAVNETETDLSWSLFSSQETDCKEYSSDPTALQTNVSWFLMILSLKQIQFVGSHFHKMTSKESSDH